MVNDLCEIIFDRNWPCQVVDSERFFGITRCKTTGKHSSENNKQQSGEKMLACKRRVVSNLGVYCKTRDQSLCLQRVLLQTRVPCNLKKKINIFNNMIKTILAQDQRFMCSTLLEKSVTPKEGLWLVSQTQIILIRDTKETRKLQSCQYSGQELTFGVLVSINTSYKYCRNVGPLSSSFTTVMVTIVQFLFPVP